MSLSSGDLKDLQETEERLFGISNKWYDIGLQLLLSADVLDEIGANSNSTQHCLCEMLKRWQRKVNPHLTWKAVVDALNQRLQIQFRFDPINTTELQQILSACYNSPAYT